MKHMQADKHTIAWFKIAECVSRGEKERALGVYRLLSHSFNDDAVARQLEADIHFFCNEQERAIFLYRQAIELYKKSQRFMEAAAIAEHLILLLPCDMMLRYEIIACYNVLGFMNKMHTHFRFLFELYARDNKWQEIENFIHKNDMNFDPIVRGLLYKQVIVVAHNNPGHADVAMVCIEKAIEGLYVEGHEQVLQEFLAALCAIDEELYHYALDYLGKK